MWSVAPIENPDMHLPVAFSTMDRGIQLLWQDGQRQTLLIFRPSKQLLEVSIKNLGELSSRQEVSIEDALDIARRAMRAE